MKPLFYLALLMSLALPALADDAPAKAAAMPASPDAAPSETAEKPKKAEPKFEGEALELKKHIESLFDYSKKVNAPDASAKQEARNKIESSVDWEKIAKDCIGPSHWKKESQKNLTEFRKLLKDVILKTAFSRMDKFWDGSKYRFKTIKVTNNQADAVVKFNVKGDWVTLGYAFRRAAAGSPWMIYDISYEDLHYSKNINEQIDGFLKDQTFSTLLTKLRKRREELEDDSRPKKS